MTLAVQAVDVGADIVASGDRAARLVRRRREPYVAGFRYIGVGVFERDAVARTLASHRAAGLAEAVLAPLVERTEVAIHPHSGIALDVGTPERLEEARRLTWDASCVWPRYRPSV